MPVSHSQRDSNVGAGHSDTHVLSLSRWLQLIPSFENHSTGADALWDQILSFLSNVSLMTYERKHT